MNIILSSIKRGLRDKNTVLSNIFLALILPYIFTIIFSFGGGKEEINLAIVGESKSAVISSYCEALDKFDDGNSNISIDYNIYSENEFEKSNLSKSNDLVIKIDEKNKKINFDGSSDISIGQQAVEGLTEEFFNSMSVYESLNKQNHIKIDEKNKKINFDGSSDISIGQQAVEGLTEEFFNSMSVYESLNKQNHTPVNISDMIKNEEYSRTNEKSKSILDDMEYSEYFALVMLQMAILVGGTHAFKNTFYIKEKLGSRVKISPAKISSLLSLELVGSFCLIFIQGIAILGAVALFYGVNVNLNNILPILLLIVLLSLFAVCLGIFTTALAKKKTSGDNICSLIVTVLTLASGQLMPQMSDSFDKVSLVKLNPFLWIAKKKTSGDNICSLIVTVLTLASGQLMPQMSDSFDKVSLVKLNPFLWISKELNNLVAYNSSDNLLITLASGQLMPQMSDSFDKVSLVKLNPFLWISKELNNLVAYNSSDNLLITIGITLTVSLILMIIAIILLRRKVVK